MSTNVQTLLQDGVSDDLKNYVSSLESLNTIKHCVEESRTTNNIFRIVASFEDAGIVNSQEVPVGSFKTKMNYLLGEAIAITSEQLSRNLNSVVAAAKTWSSNLNFENQQERLNAAMDRLREPAKNSPIPEYSQLDEDQRSRVQEVFKRVLESEETHELNFISDAISRYNAGASRAILFKNLELKLKTNNAVAVYEQDAYNTVMSQETFMHLFNKWDAFDNLQSALSTQTRLTSVSLNELISNSGLMNNRGQTEIIKQALANTDFAKPINEYNQNSKPETSYHDLKTMMDGEQLIKPLSNDNWTRLKAMVTRVSELANNQIFKVDQSQTDMDTEDSYSALSSYFAVLDEMTVMLTTYLFITQTTTRNMNIIEDVITAVNILTNLLDDLFTQVNECIVEDGNISQEGVSVFINKILGIKPISEIVNENTVVSKPMAGYDGVVNLANRYLEISDELFSLKLRDNHSLSESTIKEFKTKHAATIKKMVGKDISKLEAEPLFRFMTNQLFVTKLTPEYGHVMSAEIYDERSRLSRHMYDLHTVPEYLEHVYHDGFTGKLHSYYDCMLLAYEDFEAMLQGCDPTSSPEQNKQSIVNIIENRLRTEDRSYFGPGLKLTNYFDRSGLATVPPQTITCPSLNLTTQWGFGVFNTTSVTKLYGLLSGQANKSLTLNELKDNMYLMNYCKCYEFFNQYKSGLDDYLVNAEIGYPKVKQIVDAIHEMAGIITQQITKTSAFDKAEATAYSNLINAWVKDVDDAAISIKMKTELLNMVTISVTEVLNKLKQLYNDFDVIATDFIDMAK